MGCIFSQKGGGQDKCHPPVPSNRRGFLIIIAPAALSNQLKGRDASGSRPAFKHNDSRIQRTSAVNAARHMLISCDRYLINQVVPGTRCGAP